MLLFPGRASEIDGHAADRIVHRSAVPTGMLFTFSLGLISLRIRRRVFLKFTEAVLAAKIVSFPVVLVFSCGAFRVHFHAANWINHRRFIFHASGSVVMLVDVLYH